MLGSLNLSTGMGKLMTCLTLVGRCQSSLPQPPIPSATVKARIAGDGYTRRVTVDTGSCWPVFALLSFLALFSGPLGSDEKGKMPLAFLASGGSHLPVHGGCRL